VACILRAPTDDGAKGVVVFTTPERDRFIREQPDLAEAVAQLKEHWLVGLHHNWHDHAFVYEPLFDFSMAGEGDLVSIDGTEVPLVTLDACNFVPADFAPGGTNFWDVLYVARPVAFKGMPQFLDCVDKLWDDGHRLRVLCVCPMPSGDLADDPSVLTRLEDEYTERFTFEQRRLFTLLTLRHDYPFPLDLPTLAHLYRSSRCFAHFAPDERRCRVAGYAWAAGLPVVAMAPVGSLLPPDLRRPPFFYEVPHDGGFPDRILAALAAVEQAEDPAADAVRRQFATADTTLELRRQLAALAPGAGLDADNGWALDDLDIRLGRHHGIAAGPNGVAMTLADLLALLRDDPSPLAAAVRERDPEAALSRRAAPAPAHVQTPEAGRPARPGWRSLLGGRR
jgi:hypothetical protein